MKKLSTLIKESISRELATVAFGKRMAQWSKGMQNSGSGPVAAKARGLYNNKLNTRNIFQSIETGVTEKQHPLYGLYRDSVKFFNKNPNATVLDPGILPKKRTYNAPRPQSRSSQGGQQGPRSNYQRRQYNQGSSGANDFASTVKRTVIFGGGAAAAMAGMSAVDNYFKKRDEERQNQQQEKAAALFKETFVNMITGVASNRD